MLQNIISNLKEIEYMKAFFKLIIFNFLISTMMYAQPIKKHPEKVQATSSHQQGGRCWLISTYCFYGIVHMDPH